MGLALGALACTPTATPDDPAPTAAASNAASPVDVPATAGDCPPVIDFTSRLASLSVDEGDVSRAGATLGTEPADFTVGRYEQYARTLRGQMDDPLPALAHWLTDPGVGDSAASTMFVVDADRAAPYVFGSMPASDRNVQFHAFEGFLRRRYAGGAHCWDAVVSDGARRTLQAEPPADVAEPALLALGLTGVPGDIPLLTRFGDNDHDVAMWKARMRNAALAAAARLGDGAAVESLRASLADPMPAAPSIAEAEERARRLFAAGFSADASLVPVVCAHLDAPMAEPDQDLLPPDVRAAAARALGHIVDSAPPDDRAADVDGWRTRCRARTP